MKVLFSILSIAFLLNGYAQKKQQTETMTLKSIVETINNSIEGTAAELEGVSIQKAEITLQTVFDKTSGGGFKIFVKAKKQWNRTKSSSINYSFVPKKDIKELTTFSKDNMEKHLSTAIEKAAKEWKSMQTSITGLEKSEFSISISFTAKNINSAGIEFEILGISFDGGRDWNRAVVHSIELTFK
ncbi:MAG: hypothetical protein AB8B74_03250 [Crocinitomicaceae bacterium]